MTKDNDQIKHDAEVAQFRFALIAPVVQGLFPIWLLICGGHFLLFLCVE